MGKHFLFENETQEYNFWRGCFIQLFKDYYEHTSADSEDDDKYGVDVWVKRRKNPVKIGVQLKTQRNERVNLPYAMSCSSGWQERIGIYTYALSNKLDYLIIAYPYFGNCYVFPQAQLKSFWNKYRKELGDYSKFSWTKNNECKKYYFSQTLNQFLNYCNRANVKYELLKVKPI